MESIAGGKSDKSRKEDRDMVTRNWSKWMLSLGLVGILSSMHNAHASSFQLMLEQDAARIGDLNAGGAAQIDSASVGFYNPAGLTEIDKVQVTTGVSIVDAETSFRGRVESELVHDSSGEANAADSSQFVGPIPNFHYAHPISDRLVLGFGVTVPFGLATDYGEDTDIKFIATKSQVKTLNFSPTVGYQVSRRISIGAGVSLQQAKLDLDQVVGVRVNGRVYEATSVNELNDWGFGFNAGMLFKLDKTTRVGIHYRSPVKLKPSGKSTLQGDALVVNSDVTPRGTDTEDNRTSFTKVSDNKVHTKITMPGMATLSLFHEPTPRFSIYGSVNYTQWSTIDRITLHNVVSQESLTDGTFTLIDIVSDQQLSDTWSAFIGSSYQFNDMVKFRAGLGYDQSPTSDLFREVRNPDNDRYLVGVGLEYHPRNKPVHVDIGWTHVFVRDANINVRQEVDDIDVRARGISRSHADVLGLQVTWDIC